MNIEESINNQYAEYCKRLGDLTLREQQIKEQIEDVKSKITSLLSNQTMLQAYEQLIKKEAENERSKCASCACSSGLPADESGNDGQDQKDASAHTS